MENKDSPAHPHYYGVEIGLTKREYFAALALQGIIANQSYNDVTTKNICRDAIDFADNLLKELEGEE